MTKAPSYVGSLVSVGLVLRSLGHPTTTAAIVPLSGAGGRGGTCTKDCDF